MKIKHWQGYGSLNAKVVKKTTDTSTHSMGYIVKTITVQVSGNHEYGLDRSDYKEDVVRWLSKVIKDDTLNEALNYSGPQSYNFWNNVDIKFNYIDDIDGQEAAQYTIEYKVKW